MLSDIGIKSEDRDGYIQVIVSRGGGIGSKDGDINGIIIGNECACGNIMPCGWEIEVAVSLGMKVILQL